MDELKAIVKELYFSCSFFTRFQQIRLIHNIIEHLCRLGLLCGCKYTVPHKATAGGQSSFRGTMYMYLLCAMVSLCTAWYITGYGSTLYIGFAMVFVFSPYFTSCFQFQVNLTFNDFTAQNMSQVICVPNISLNYHFLAKLKKQCNFSILSMVFFFFFFFFFFFLWLNSHNSITIVPLHMKLRICTGFGRS